VLYVISYCVRSRNQTGQQATGNAKRHSQSRKSMHYTPTTPSLSTGLVVGEQMKAASTSALELDVQCRPANKRRSFVIEQEIHCSFIQQSWQMQLANHSFLMVAEFRSHNPTQPDCHGRLLTASGQIFHAHSFSTATMTQIIHENV
jgi:hypothetical protein